MEELENQWPFDAPKLEVPSIYKASIYKAYVFVNLPTIYMAQLIWYLPYLHDSMEFQLIQAQPPL